MPVGQPDPASSGRENEDPVQLSLVEVKQLWWFTDGSIMDPGVRQGLGILDLPVI